MKCKGCNLEFSPNHFNQKYHDSKCSLKGQYNRMYAKNKEKICLASQKYYNMNKNNIVFKQKRKIYNKQYGLNHKKERLEYVKNYNIKNKQKNLQYQYNWSKQRYKNNIEFHIITNMRKRLERVLSYKKNNTTIELIGCSISQLKNYLENKFQPGMNWQNYGKHGWHIDHIKPISSFIFNDTKQQKECFHYTNLQPLWAKDNLQKSNKIIEVVV